MILWEAKNKYSGYRSVCGRFYLQQSPKRFYWVFDEQAERSPAAGPFGSAREAKEYAEAA